jgi:ABC-type lipoprotein release transport system permease subunit
MYVMRTASVERIVVAVVAFSFALLAAIIPARTAARARYCDGAL